MAEGYLPEIVIEVTGDISQFLRDLELAKIELQKFSQEGASAPVGADISYLEADLGAATAMLETWARGATAKANIGGNTNAFWTELNLARTGLDSWRNEIATAALRVNIGDVILGVAEAEAAIRGFEGKDVDVDVKTATALGHIAAVQGATDALTDRKVKIDWDAYEKIDMEGAEAVEAPIKPVLGADQFRVLAEEIQNFFDYHEFLIDLNHNLDEPGKGETLLAQIQQWFVDNKVALHFEVDYENLVEVDEALAEHFAGKKIDIGKDNVEVKAKLEDLGVVAETITTKLHLDVTDFDETLDSVIGVLTTLTEEDFYAIKLNLDASHFMGTVAIVEGVLEIMADKPIFVRLQIRQPSDNDLVGSWNNIKNYFQNEDKSVTLNFGVAKGIEKTISDARVALIDTGTFLTVNFDGEVFLEELQAFKDEHQSDFVLPVVFNISTDEILKRLSFIQRLFEVNFLQITPTIKPPLIGETKAMWKEWKKTYEKEFVLTATIKAEANEKIIRGLVSSVESAMKTQTNMALQWRLSNNPDDIARQLFWLELALNEGRLPVINFDVVIDWERYEAMVNALSEAIQETPWEDISIGVKFADLNLVNAWKDFVQNPAVADALSVNAKVRFYKDGDTLKNALGDAQRELDKEPLTGKVSGGKAVGTIPVTLSIDPKTAKAVWADFVKNYKTFFNLDAKINFVANYNSMGSAILGAARRANEKPAVIKFNAKLNWTQASIKAQMQTLEAFALSQSIKFPIELEPEFTEESAYLLGDALAGLDELLAQKPTHIRIVADLDSEQLNNAITSVMGGLVRSRETAWKIQVDANTEEISEASNLINDTVKTLDGWKGKKFKAIVSADLTLLAKNLALAQTLLEAFTSHKYNFDITVDPAVLAGVIADTFESIKEGVKGPAVAEVITQLDLFSAAEDVAKLNKMTRARTVEITPEIVGTTITSLAEIIQEARATNRQVSAGEEDTRSSVPLLEDAAKMAGMLESVVTAAAKLGDSAGVRELDAHLKRANDDLVNFINLIVEANETAMSETTNTFASLKTQGADLRTYIRGLKTDYTGLGNAAAQAAIDTRNAAMESEEAWSSFGQVIATVRNQMGPMGMSTGAALKEAGLSPSAVEMTQFGKGAKDENLLTMLQKSFKTIAAIKAEGEFIGFGHGIVELDRMGEAARESAEAIRQASVDMDNLAKTATADFARLTDEASKFKGSVDLAPLWVELQEISKAFAEGTSTEIRVDAIKALTDAQIVLDEIKAKASIADAVTTIKVHTKVQDPEGALAKITRALSGGAKGGLGGGILSDLTGGADGRGPFIPGTRYRMPGGAKFGSIGSMAGFGTEHIVATAGGLLGSLGGAALGGGLLATAGLTTSAIGMGTDMAGMGQAAGNAKKLTKDLEALDAAQEQYGQNSKQYAAAQQQYAADLGYITPVAQQATGALAAAFHNLGEQYKLATGDAQKTGAEILTQFTNVASKYVPVLGKFAGENMKIMKTNIQPFLGWLKDSGSAGGLGIFTQLETAFQQNLPTSIHAVTTAFELFMKTVSHIVSADGVGGLMRGIDNFVTKMNGTDFSGWIAGVDGLIRQYQVWKSFFKALGSDLILLAQMMAGLATGTKADPEGIIPTLTKWLNELNKALSTTTGSSALGTIFSEHKKEVLTIIDMVIRIGVVFGEAYIAAAPVILKITNLLLTVLDTLLKVTNIKFMHIGDFALMAMGIGLISSKLGILGPLLGGASKNAGLFGKAFGFLGTGGLTGLSAKDIDNKKPMGLAARGLRKAFGIGEEIAGIEGADPTTMTWGKKFKGYAEKGWAPVAKRQATGGKLEGGFIDPSGMLPKEGKIRGWANTFKSTFGELTNLARGFAGKFATAMAGMVMGQEAAAGASRGLKLAMIGLSTAGVLVVAFAVYELIKHFGVMKGLMIAGAAAVGVLTVALIVMDAVPIVALVVGIGLAIAGLVAGIFWLAKNWDSVWNGIKNVSGAVWNFIKGVFNAGWNFIKTHIDLIVGIIFGPFGFAVAYIATHWDQVWGIVKGVIHGAWDVIQNVFNAIVGAAEALWNGIYGAVSKIVDWFMAFPGKIWDLVKDAGTWLVQAGKDIISGLMHGIINAPLDAIKGIGKSVIGAFRTALGWFSDPAFSLEAGHDIMAGLTHGMVNNQGMATNAAANISALVVNGIKVDSTQLNKNGAAFTQGIADGMTSQSAVLAQAAQTINAQLVAAFAGGQSADRAGQNIKLAAQNVEGVGTIFSNIKKVFGDLASAADSLQNVPVNVAAVTTALGDLRAKTDGKTISDQLGLIEKAFKSVGDPKAIGKVADSMGGIGKLFDNFGAAATSAAKVTDDAVGALLTSLGKFSNASGSITQGIESIVNSFADMGNTNTMLPIPNVDVNAIQKVGKNFIDPFAAVKTADTGISKISTLLKDIGKLFDLFGSTAKSAKDLGTDAFGQIWTGMGHILGSIGPLLRGIESVAKSIDTLKTGSAAVGGNQGFKAIKVSSLIGDLTDLMNVFKKVSDLFEAIKGTMFSSGGIDSGAMEPMKKAIASIATALDGLPGAVQKAAGATTALATLIANMTAAITDQSGAFKTAGGDLIQSMQNGMFIQLTIALKRESDNINNTLLGVVTGSLGSKAAHETFKQGGRDLIQQMQDGVLEQLTNAFVPREKTNIINAVNSLAPAFHNGELQSMLRTSGSDLVQQVQNGFHDQLFGAFVTRETSNINSVVGMVAGVFTSATNISLFYSAGMNMMSGLAAGIRAASSQVSNAVGGVANAAHLNLKTITLTFSPSKLYAEMGKNWMEGLVVGIDKGAAGVHSAMVGAVPSVSPSTRLAPVTGGGTHMNVTANFTIHAPGGDAKAIRGAVETDSAQQFARATLTAMRAGAGKLY